MLLWKHGDVQHQKNHLNSGIGTRRWSHQSEVGSGPGLQRDLESAAGSENREHTQIVIILVSDVDLLSLSVFCLVVFTLTKQEQSHV